MARIDLIDAIGRLPDAYVRALMWRDRGASPEEIARRLEIDVVSVAPLLQLADEKFEALATSSGN